MSEAYIGEIRMFSGNYAPQNWALCNGQVLTINNNEALFSVIGFTYGGDGQSNFALPDLRGRVPLHVGPGFAQGARGGTETVTLAEANLPPHTHTAAAYRASGGSSVAPGNMWGLNAEQTTYIKPDATIQPNASFNPAAIAAAGSSQAHDNMMPFLPVSYIICLVGNYPPRPE